MERRYDDILTARLEDAMHNGCAHITWNELYLWYRVQKIAAGTWRDLNRRLKELNNEAKPRRIEGRGGIFIFDLARSRRIDPDVE
jgi:hypothetical protein